MKLLRRPSIRYNAPVSDMPANAPPAAVPAAPLLSWTVDMGSQAAPQKRPRADDGTDGDGSPANVKRARSLHDARARAPATFAQHASSVDGRQVPGRMGFVTLRGLVHDPAYADDSIVGVFATALGIDSTWFMSEIAPAGDGPITYDVLLASGGGETNNAAKFNEAAEAAGLARMYGDRVRLIFPRLPQVAQASCVGMGSVHGKLVLVQRERSLRIIITSANLYESAFASVCNCVWHCDVFRRMPVELVRPAVLFDTSRGDFLPQLASYLAHLLTGQQPSVVARWLSMLSAFDGADVPPSAHLVASVPGPAFSPAAVQAMVEAFGARSAYSMGLITCPIVLPTDYATSGAPISPGELEALARLARPAHEDEYVHVSICARDMFGGDDGNDDWDGGDGGGGSGDVVVVVDGKVSQAPLIEAHILLAPAGSRPRPFVVGLIEPHLAEALDALVQARLVAIDAVMSNSQLAALLPNGESREQPFAVVMLLPGERCASATWPDASTSEGARAVLGLAALLRSLVHCRGLWRLEQLLTPHVWPESEARACVYSASNVGSSVDGAWTAAFCGHAGMRVATTDERWHAAVEREHGHGLSLVYPSVAELKAALVGVPANEAARQAADVLRVMKCPDAARRDLRTSVVHATNGGALAERARFARMLANGCQASLSEPLVPLHSKVCFRTFYDDHRVGWLYAGSHNCSPFAWGFAVSHDARRLMLKNFELGVLLVFPPDRLRTHAPTADRFALPFPYPLQPHASVDECATMRRLAVAGFAVRPAELQPDDDVQEGWGPRCFDKLPSQAP